MNNSAKTFITQAEVNENMKNYVVWTEKKFEKPTTFVTVKMLNGFEITRSCTCINPEKYDEQIGCEICLRRIENKVWELLGYEAMSWSSAIETSTPKQRVETETQELSDKIENLTRFLKSDTFWSMESKHKQLLINQRKIMIEYKNILEERLALKWK